MGGTFQEEGGRAWERLFLVVGGIHGPLGRAFGLGSLGSLVMLCSKSLGRYNWDFEASTLGILGGLF